MTDFLLGLALILLGYLVRLWVERRVRAMTSDLQFTGYCHLCGEPTPNLFCSKDHNATYLVYIRRGKDPATWQPRGVKKHHPRKTERKYFGPTKSPYTLDERINRIASRGTTLAPAG